MLKMIRNKYWNPTAGIFTSGPDGSMAFKDEVWETAGEEGAVWNIWGIASEEQKNLIMDNLEHKIITPYGIPLMPGHLEKTHLARSVWTVYTTGYAVAAAELGKEELLVTLIAQQIRNAVLIRHFMKFIMQMMDEHGDGLHRHGMQLVIYRYYCQVYSV